MSERTGSVTLPRQLRSVVNNWCVEAARLAVLPTILVVCAVSAAAADVDFNRDIRPILSDVCFKCHGPDEQQRVSDFRLDTKDGAFGEVDGGRAIAPGDPDGSLLYRNITSTDREVQMPPPDSGRTLTPRQIELFRQWIPKAQIGSSTGLLCRRRISSYLPLTPQTGAETKLITLFWQSWNERDCSHHRRRIVRL